MISNYGNASVLATSVALIPALMVSPHFSEERPIYDVPISISANSSTVTGYKVDFQQGIEQHLQSFYVELASKQVEPENALLNVINDHFDELLCVAN